MWASRIHSRLEGATPGIAGFKEVQRDIVHLKAQAGLTAQTSHAGHGKPPDGGFFFVRTGWSARPLIPPDSAENPPAG